MSLKKRILFQNLTKYWGKKRKKLAFCKDSATTNTESLGKQTCVKSGKRETPGARVGAGVL